MPIHLRARAAYGTFREQYRGDERNRDKITANLELVEGFETASKEAASVYISQEEQTEPDPHMFSAEENINLTQNLMGHNRRGRYPLHGVGASPGISIRSSTASSTPSTSTRAATSSFQAMPFVARISAYLIDKIDPGLHIQSGDIKGSSTRSRNRDRDTPADDDG
ncbi:uncharacterized protein LOC109841672 [Asparagus officinalis]|uniref:uncharacterized protein LOC109841672 n=1 Tax=Asparagus officinalis TaxID=4686 RepID=UPI00098E3618|nr:uncharacterized protein LOC109841672 [Asparagus officinalis]